MSPEARSVEVQGLTVRFGEFTAVREVSFSVDTGEIFGFLGANGAGKTTTIRVLCGLLEPTAGRARVAGIDVIAGQGGGVSATAGREAMRLKERVGYMSQRFTLYNDLTVAENLDFAAALRKLEHAVYRRRRTELLELISFHHGLDTRVGDLSGGVKQQVSLAASLLHDPEIVFLDEPTAGVTPVSRARFWELIRRIASRGKTVFVTTHYMDEAEHCGRIALMRTGELIALDTPAGLKRSAFPGPMVELDPIRALAPAEHEALRSDQAFSYLEPYGLRFHAAIARDQEDSGWRARLAPRFRMRYIEPTLEDVFIHRVEGQVEGKETPA